MKKLIIILSILTMTLTLFVSAQSTVTIYTKDGRSRVVEASKLDAWLKVGWYEGVELYNSSGSSKVVSPFNVEAEKKNGWSKSYEDFYTLLYAPDGRIKEVTNDKVEANVKVGWSKTPCEDLRYDDGKNYSIRPANFHNPSASTIYIEHGETTFNLADLTGYSFQNVSRIEIPDTVTYIPQRIPELSNDEITTVTRIGIPKSVELTYTINCEDKQYASSWGYCYCDDAFGFDHINFKKQKGNLTIYCEKGSDAEAYAKYWGINYVYATIIYRLDEKRTMMVSDAEKKAYLKSKLWYAFPAMTVYHKDGKSTIINRNDLSEYKASGWYDNKYDAFMTVYSADGRTKEIGKNQLEAYKKVGWYDSLITIYAKDGRTKQIGKTQLEAYKKVGWYENIDDVRTLMIAEDGRYKYVYDSAVEANKKVGWYTVDEGLDLIINKGYIFRALHTVLDMKSDIPNDEFNRLKAKISKQITDVLDGCPISETVPFVSANKNGIPEVSFYIYNFSTRTVTGFTAEFYCYDKNGNLTKDYGSAKVTATASNLNLKGFDYTECTVTLSANTKTTSVKNFDITKVFLEYTTPWYK